MSDLVFTSDAATRPYEAPKNIKAMGSQAWKKLLGKEMQKEMQNNGTAIFCRGSTCKASVRLSCRCSPR